MRQDGEIAFARKASGLVRGLSMWDAFGVGFMNQGLTPSIWVMVSLGLSVYMGGNLIIATILSLVLAGIGFPLVWGILGGSMPRSGGEYIYNSRIIHPLIGIGESFGNAFIWLMWIYVLAPWIADPGAKMMSEFMGWTWLYNSAADTYLGGLSPAWGSFVLASIANVIAVLFVVFGVKVFARAQKVVMGLGILGMVAIIVALFMYTKQDFVSNWNSMATQYGSLNYNDFIKAAGDAAGHDHADHLELVRHLRGDGRRLLALRLFLLHHVHRRRSQAAGQEHHPLQPLRHHRAGRLHDPHRRGPLPPGGLQLPVRLGLGRSERPDRATRSPGARTSWGSRPS